MVARGFTVVDSHTIVSARLDIDVHVLFPVLPIRTRRVVECGVTTRDAIRSHEQQRARTTGHAHKPNNSENARDTDTDPDHRHACGIMQTTRTRQRRERDHVWMEVDADHDSCMQRSIATQTVEQTELSICGLLEYN
jgi:hypothetical protein